MYEKPTILVFDSEMLIAAFGSGPCNCTSGSSRVYKCACGSSMQR